MRVVIKIGTSTLAHKTGLLNILRVEELCKVIAKAQEARKDGLQVLVVRMNKNKKFQKEQLLSLRK